MKKIKELLIEKLILICGLASIFFVLLIFLFLLKEGLAVFKTVSSFNFLFGKSWYPISEPPALGILPLIMGSLLVTLGAAIISIPIGVGCAIYIAEIAPLKIKEILKAGIELLAAIPSVVLGFIGMVTLVPLVKTVFHLPTGLTALSGAIMLAFMAMPTIVSIAEDALYSVPKTYKEGALALGATHWQAIWRVMLPAASSGIVAAVMLGIGRVIGETMAVMMITGNAAVMPNSILVPVRTLTATIAAEMGEAVVGAEHYFALFAVGIVLFVISFAINVTADLFLHKRQ
ncbi:MAG: phosphate ABC transporter permease subunit PstC [Candidatus Omnitrophica bacterium CG1_02_44_16]|nr:MAG: phosphate ABC transporter permease subunit PstC [Candidatus Omnitrophica bacterium CG1_02_44_16]PIY83557.1 MAG: phosphate ABC transporter permease subunit PstC [Candidatus Omnitrophica bacterium CG_4_10_14_0_8_um_filter_44_12]PIZ83959.1 MAG: phosphate ABC transporter permease subunit PstC [Candidatus Omnitrophica bacterium CG_4_10_14_0_2_um_filter_44_9]